MTVMWLDENSGVGMGICEFATSFVMAMAKPKQYNNDTGRYDDDWPSVVAVRGPESKYTKDELAKLYEFGARRTERYDEMFRWRLGCNLIIVDKFDDGRWAIKRQTWYHFSIKETMQEVFDLFDKEM